MSSELVVGSLMEEAVLESLKETLQIEAQSLLACAERIDHNFVKAIQVILSCKGKVIATGLGKSGHIARKIAATMASTGTPAFFLHPSEALHGDLGMVGLNDVVLALAFGGETREVVEVAKFARRNSVPVIAISGNKNSTLSSLADAYLDGSVAKEACPLNLAPTSSSLLSMAIGDALSVALMRARGFLHNDFAKLHPEGTLGRRLATVRDYTKPIDQKMILHKNDSFERVLAAVMSMNFGFAMVANEDNSLAGVITDGDVRRVVAKYKETVFSQCAEALMSTQPKTIPAEALAIDAVQEMERYSISVLLVFAASSPNQPLGIIRMHDLLAAKVV